MDNDQYEKTSNPEPANTGTAESSDRPKIMGYQVRIAEEEENDIKIEEIDEEEIKPRGRPKRKTMISMADFL